MKTHTWFTNYTREVLKGTVVDKKAEKALAGLPNHSAITPLVRRVLVINRLREEGLSWNEVDSEIEDIYEVRIDSRSFMETERAKDILTVLTS